MKMDSLQTLEIHHQKKMGKVICLFDMKFPANPLSLVLMALSEQGRTLSVSRFKYLSKEAERKTYEARLIKGAQGSSHAERTTNAQATEEWRKFHVELSRLESEFEFEKMKWEVLSREYLAQLLSLKLDAQQIIKGAE